TSEPVWRSSSKKRPPPLSTGPSCAKLSLYCNAEGGAFRSKASPRAENCSKTKAPSSVHGRGQGYGSKVRGEPFRSKAIRRCRDRSRRSDLLVAPALQLCDWLGEERMLMRFSAAVATSREDRCTWPPFRARPSRSRVLGGEGEGGR